MPIMVTENNTKKSDYANSILCGASLGYSAKWLIPVISPEKQTAEYKYFLSTVKKKALDEKYELLNTLKNNKNNYSLARDYYDKNGNSAFSFKSIRKIENKNLKDQVLSIVSQSNAVARDARMSGRSQLKTFTKSIRPTAAFILIGAGIAFVIETVKSISSSIKNDKI
ncbi:hypothetical protein KBA27_02915 [bacterium]|nr:hypothetical protein [bacterium]